MLPADPSPVPAGTSAILTISSVRSNVQAAQDLADLVVLYVIDRFERCSVVEYFTR